MALQKEYILDKIDNIETNIGTLSNLSTTEKSNLVGSLNETTTNINTKIGTLANLNTTVKDSIVNAVCEVKDNINDIILGGVPDDSITDIKLSSTGIKATVAQHTTDISGINTELAEKTQKDIIFLSAYLDGATPTDRLQNAINYTSTNKLKLYIDETVTLTRTITLPSRTQLYSNPYKYIITTNEGTLDNGMTLMESYNCSNIIVDGVKFQNKGYGTSGGLGTPGLFDGFGAGLCFGGCNNITVKNCEFFMCGGYRYYEGCGQLWFSCCTNVLADNNICEVGDNGIICDRWCASKSDIAIAYNSGVVITNNRITNMSGRGIGIESVYGHGDYVITNNSIRSFGVAGIQADGLDDGVITGNVINGNADLKINPSVRYGLSLPGWDWSSAGYGSIETNGENGILISYADDNILISGNNINHVTNAIVSTAPLKLNVIGNQMSAIVKGIICTTLADHGTNTKYITINSNNMYDLTDCGIEIVDDIDGATITNVSISGNHISTNLKGIYLKNITDVSITSNNIKGLSDVATYSDDKYAIRLDGSSKIHTLSNYISNHCVYMYVNTVSILNTNDSIRNVTNCFKIADGTTSSLAYIQGCYNSVTNFFSGSGTVTGDAKKASVYNITGQYKTGVGHNIPITISRGDTTVSGYVAKGDTIINTNITDVSPYGWVAYSNIGETVQWKVI